MNKHPMNKHPSKSTSAFPVSFILTLARRERRQNLHKQCKFSKAQLCKSGAGPRGFKSGDLGWEDQEGWARCWRDPWNAPEVVDIPCVSPFHPTEQFFWRWYLHSHSKFFLKREEKKKEKKEKRQKIQDGKSRNWAQTWEGILGCSRDSRQWWKVLFFCGMFTLCFKLLWFYLAVLEDPSV